MIGSVISEYRSYSVFIGEVKSEGSDGSFGDALAEAAENDLMKNAPDKWVTEAGLLSDAMKKAEEYMRNELGINVGEIEPTHELSPEQKEWLSSRHDFSTMQRYVRYSFVNDSGITQIATKSTAEYSNFVADLVYLGVFTQKDMVDMWTEPIDTRPGVHQAILSDRLGGGENDILSAADMFVKHLEKMFNFYDKRSKDPARAVNGDAEFAELFRRQLALPKLFLKLLDELFGSSDEELPQSSAVPPIEDASGKLKEDFGGLGKA